MRFADYLTAEVYHCGRLSARPCAVLGPLAVQGNNHTCARSFSLPPWLALSLSRPARSLKMPLPRKPPKLLRKPWTLPATPLLPLRMPLAPLPPLLRKPLAMPLPPLRTPLAPLLTPPPTLLRTLLLPKRRCNLLSRLRNFGARRETGAPFP